MKRLILLGGGHTHLAVLRHFAATRLAGAECVLVSPTTTQTYSGMLPGYIQGTYHERELSVDLPALCRAAGVRFRQEAAEAIDGRGGWVRVPGETIECDLISADVGAAAAGLDRVPGVATHAAPLRPISMTAALLGRLDALLAAPDARGRAAGDAPLTVCVVGGGAAGVEIALAVQQRCRRAGRHAAVTLVERSGMVLGERGERDALRVAHLLMARGIHIVTGCAVTAVHADHVMLDAGGMIPAALTIWLAGAAPTALTAASALPKDGQGYWLVSGTLRSVGGGAVWGAGDCIALDGYPWVPKAGVYAVRQGPVLAANLRTAVERGIDAPAARMRRYVPQASYLSLLNTADGKALLRWRGHTLHARWVWWLKHRIDHGFVAQYQRAAAAAG